MALDTLHLDLSESATRKQIFGALVTPLDDQQRGIVGSIVGDLSIRSEEHFHDVGEVFKGIDRTIARESIKQRAKDVYMILAEAESEVHGCPVEETHFHEVGKGMTVREVLGICACVELLAPGKVTATPIQTGSGKVECAHGLLDIPAPATAAIIERFSLPVQDAKLEGELCTPTSAALIANLVDEFV